MQSKLVYLSILAQIYAQITTSGPVSNQSTTDFPPQYPNQQPQQKQQLNCFIDENFVQMIELFHVIGVRKNGSLLKISEKDEEFPFDFFYPRDNQNMVVYPTIPTESSTNPSSTSPPKKSSNGSMTLKSRKAAAAVSNATLSTVPPQVSSTTLPPSTFSDRLTNETFVDGITVAVDVENGRFHFLVPDHAFRYYKLSYSDYKQQVAVMGEPVSFEDFDPIFRARRLPEPYTCHYNIRKNVTCCVSIESNGIRKVTVGNYGMHSAQNKQEELSFELPDYLSFNEFHSYSDSSGTDFILFHHMGEWIYRFSIQEYLTTGNLFFKVFHLRFQADDYEFHSFEHADEHGLVTKYRNEEGLFRYIYSLFSEVSGLSSFCVHDKPIDGSLMIIARKRPEPEQGMTAELRSMARIEKGEQLEFPTMLHILFYCTLLYLTIFVGVQMIPVRKIRIGKELRRLEREVQRVAPVIEKIVAKVHTYLETEKEAVKHKQY